jgi:hypothetical protein
MSKEIKCQYVHPRMWIHGLGGRRGLNLGNVKYKCSHLQDVLLS